MSRLVQYKPVKQAESKYTDGELAAGDGNPVNEHLEMIAKYVPAEIIAAYIAVNGFMASLPPDMIQTTLRINFFLFAILTPVYFKILGKKSEPVLTQQIVSFMAFIIWGYSITGDSGIFGTNGWHIYYGPIAAGIMTVFTLISGWIIPRK